MSDDIDYHTTAVNEAWQRAHFAGETDVVELISAAMRNVERGNRWAAFTDDELVMLQVGPYQITAHGVGTTDALALREEIRAEIERRKTGAT